MNVRLSGRHGIEHREPDAPRPAHERQVGTEKVHEPVRERDAGPAVLAPAGDVVVEHRACPDRLARRPGDHALQFPRVAQAHVEALPRHRVQRLRGVADRDDARGDRRAREFHHQRKGLPPPRPQEIRPPATELRGEARDERVVRQR
ncbi:MAG: hypothetical protein IPI87_00050 [Betaproteobacteria bacterium]|nr:hypothetical protein [Betaproteobacteria bacterium]